MPPKSRGARRRHRFPRPTIRQTSDELAASIASQDAVVPSVPRTLDEHTPIRGQSAAQHSSITANSQFHETALASQDSDIVSGYDPDPDHTDSQSRYSVFVGSSDTDSRLDAIDDLSRSISSSASSEDDVQQQALSEQASLPPPSLPLFPPFYNRPPTPLPPSPSLTSLLRPPSLLNRSTTSTHPNTPDSSDVDVETPNDTEAAVAQSARRATIVSRVSPKVPTYEYYGFVLYLASSLAFLLYILWSYLPSPLLAAIGLHYYPNRWWSLAIPAFLVMLIIYIYIALLSYNVEYLTLPMNSVECMVDDAANVATVDAQYGSMEDKSMHFFKNRRSYSTKTSEWPVPDVEFECGSLLKTVEKPFGRANTCRDKKVDWTTFWNEGTDAVMDIPIGGVCQVLYGADRNADPGIESYENEME